MTTPAQVAVIIPTHNHAQYLSRAIGSVLEQTFPANEIVVIDDGSTDQPGSVVRAFPQIQLISQPNLGLAAARNTGLRATTAEYLVFLDADDRLRPQAIAANMDLLKSDPEAGIAYAAYCNVNGATGAISPAVFRPVPRRSFSAFLGGNVIGMHAAVMYRRKALEAIGGFREDLRACEDYDVYLRLAYRYPVLCQPVIVAEYWRHESNMSRDLGLMLGSALNVLRTYRLQARQSGLSEEYWAGLNAWKQFYSSSWLQAAKDMAVSRTFNREVTRQGFSILLLAPGHLIRETAAALARKLEQ